MVINPNELKKRRISIGMTQQGLAKAIGVAQGIISKFESNKNYPGYLALKKIEEGLDLLENHKLKKVKEIMIKKVFYVAADTTINQVIKKFKEKGYSQAPVIKNKHIIGMVTTKSILEAEKNHKVEEYLEPAPPTVSEEVTIKSIKPLLKHFNIILVLDKGKVAGIISRQDLL